MYHNDYTVLVKEYLNRYNEFKQYVANVEAEIEDYSSRPSLRSPACLLLAVVAAEMGPARRNGRTLNRRTWKNVSKTAIRTFLKCCRKYGSWTGPWMR